MSLLNTEIQEATTKIKNLFVDQCTALARARQGLDPGEFCCGQFLGNDAASLSQRGIHGLSSAIRVLAEENGGNAVTVTDGLVYSANKFVTNLPTQLKTIKLAELLFSITKASTRSHYTSIFSTLRNLLLSAKQNNGQFGWPFLIDGANPRTGETHLLPSVYVFQALWNPGNSGLTEDLLHHIEENIKSYFNKTPQKLDVELYTIIFALYVISHRKRDLSRSEEDRYKGYLKKLQERIGQTIREDSGQNVEYLDEDRGYYVRIPWQLYLLALVARFRPHQIYQTLYKNRIKDICKRISNAEFIYPYAGRLLSSRTHAIACECLHHINDSLQAIPLRDQIWYSFRGWLGHRIVRFLFAVLVFFFVGYFYYLGIKDEGLDLKGLASELNGSLVSFVIVYTISIVGVFKKGGF